MKKCMFALIAMMLLLGSRLSASALFLVFTISVDGGATFGRASSKTTTGGLASLVATPSEGSLNLSTGTIDFRGDSPLVLVTPRNANDPGADTIVENFDYRIRVAVQGTGVTPATLGGASPAFPYVEFRHTGTYTLSNIKQGSVIRTFNSTPSGGDFGGTGTSAQTLFLAGVGDLTLSLRGFTLPAQPQSDPSGDFRSYGRLNYRLGLASLVTLSGRITLQDAVSNSRLLTFTFSPADNSPAFQRLVVPNAAGDYSVADLPPQIYSVRVKGSKWLAKRFNVDATQGSVSNVNQTLIAGDINNDNFIDVADLLLIISFYNKVSPDSGYSDAADLNGDGADDVADLLLVIANYNKQGDS